MKGYHHSYNSFVMYCAKLSYKSNNSVYIKKASAYELCIEMDTIKNG